MVVFGWPYLVIEVVLVCRVVVKPRLEGSVLLLFTVKRSLRWPRSVIGHRSCLVIEVRRSFLVVLFGAMGLLSTHRLQRNVLFTVFAFEALVITVLPSLPLLLVPFLQISQ